MLPTTEVAVREELEHLRDNLVLGRARAGLSQIELAKRADVARATIARLESRDVRYNVDLKTLISLARALGVSLTELLRAPEPDLDDEHAELRRRAEDPRDADIPFREAIAAYREADGLTRYSRAGRRPRMGR